MSKLQKGRGEQLQSLSHTTIIGLKPNEETSEVQMAVPSEKHFDKWFTALRNVRSLAMTKNLTTKPWLDSQHIIFHYVYTRDWNCKKAEEQLQSLSHTTTTTTIIDWSQIKQQQQQNFIGIWRHFGKRLIELTSMRPLAVTKKKPWQQNLDQILNI